MSAPAYYAAGASYGGLSIDRATYHTMDVTSHLQKAVAASGGSRLYVPSGTDYNEYFRNDPAYGNPKQLVIIYHFPGSPELKSTFREREQILIEAPARPAQAPVSYGVSIDRATYHTMDVTAHLQKAVAAGGGRLYIPNGTDYNQYFGNDPAPGVGKNLVILYRLPGSPELQTTFSERQQVLIEPQQAQVQPSYPPTQEAVYPPPAAYQPPQPQQPSILAGLATFLQFLNVGPVRVALRDHLGRFLHATNDGRVAVSSSLGEHEVFRLHVLPASDSFAGGRRRHHHHHHHHHHQQQQDAHVRFQSERTGKWLCAESNNTLVCNRDGAGEWETFALDHHENNTVSFFSSHAHYVCSEDNGSVVANRDGAGPWEKFHILRL